MPRTLLSLLVPVHTNPEGGLNHGRQIPEEVPSVGGVGSLHDIDRCRNPHPPRDGQTGLTSGRAPT